MLKREVIALTALLLLAAVGVNAQVTTASMAGKVTDASNEPIIGATVQAVHQPSGSRYGTVTNVDGRYSIQGMLMEVDHLCLRQQPCNRRCLAYKQQPCHRHTHFILIHADQVQVVQKGGICQIRQGRACIPNP